MRMSGLMIRQSDGIPWEPHALPGSIRKVLATDKRTGSYVHRRYVFPGSVPQPARRYHRSVRETFLFLWGHLPSWEFNDVADTEGHFVEFRRGTFMDRPPFSIHGRHPEAKSVTGCEFLIWTSHGGEFEADPLESEQVPFSGPSGVAPFSATQVVVIDTESLDWVDHPSLDGVSTKVLSRESPGGGGIDPVVLVYLPPSWPSRNLSLTFTERGWAYVVAGSMRLANTSWEVGTFASWATATGQDSGPRAVGREGCLCLTVGRGFSL